MNPRRDDAIREAAARAHADADPNAKKLAARMDVSPRSAQRYRSPDYAKGSPLHRLGLYLDGCPNPHRVVANARTYLYRGLKDLSRTELVAQIREHYAEDGRVEGEDNASRFALGVGALDRAALHERDAAEDEWLAAAWREVAARGMTEADVLGGAA